MTEKFLTFFPNCKFRYLDLSGGNKPPISSDTQKDELNKQGYDSFFTPNGFAGNTATRDNCINLSAFYIDIDHKLSEAEMDEIKKTLDPTFIIKTMQGFHFYWLLDEPIFRAENPGDWEAIVARWERIEQAIVNAIPNADKAVKDIPRILRVPDTIYFKKTDGTFKIKGIYKKPANTYSMAEVEAVFPSTAPATVNSLATTTNDRIKKMADAERVNFFERVNEEFPIEERDSFQRLINAHPDALLPGTGRNTTLLITSCLMRQAKWTKKQAIEQIEKVGWYGMEKEPGGAREILTTIDSAFNGNYTYSYKNDVISFNMSPIENQRIQQAYVKVAKDRKDQDKVRFSNYEQELLVKHPHLRKNEIGIIFQYRDGVYKMMSDQDISDLILQGLYDDMLWNYRTNKNVSDKVACLLSIIPLLVVTDDKGYIANVKNGLLNIYTKELMPHSPTFVSLIQYPVVYDPAATAPVWDRCVHEWMKGPEWSMKIKLLKQFCGYCLSSSMLYDRALFMVGDGGNGKSTFIDTIAMVLGPDATSHIDLEGLYDTFGMHGLIGKRLNIIEEVHGNYYQSNKLKKLISGEQVTIDIKYKPQFTFRPQAKFVFSVNMLPRVDDTSTATERRILAVQFLNNYRENPNYELRSSVGLLAQELSGILNWMVAGAIDLANDKKFVITNEQTRILDEYREENSSVEGFLSECVILNPTTSIETPTLYNEYKRWSMTDGGRKIKSKITFNKEVRAFGAKGKRFTFEPRASGHLEAKFAGIALSPQWIAQCQAYLA
jgi:P4 family phage/plasmid primase-like protien